MLNREFNNLPQDSIPNADLITYLEIINNQNDISDSVMAFLNFQFDSTFVISPEVWEEESSRPIINPKSNKETREHHQKTKLETSIYPNPSNNELTVYFDSNEYDLLDIQIVNLIGNIVFESSKLKKQEIVNLNVSNLIPGVYNLKYNYQGRCIENKKIVIIH